MQRNIDLTVPDRRTGEPDLTSKQSDFLDDLISTLEIEDAGIDYQSLGKWQASALIDQLIAIRDTGVEIVGAQPTGRRMTFLMGLGIFIAPYIFAWATLVPGFSSRERVFSFAWMLVFIASLYFGMAE